MASQHPPTHCFEIRDSRSDSLRATLERGWEAGLGSGLVVYDPAAVEEIHLPPFRFHYLPHRAGRPGAAPSPLPPTEGLRLPHIACPFDGDGFVVEREIARLTRDERTYHVTCNRYPVTPVHFLVVRSESSPRETLPQCLHGAEEIEDLLLTLCMLGEPYRAYFNSNRGADGSQSGSSVNHWHFQVFSLARPSPLTQLRLEVDGTEGDLRFGRVPDWPARHVFVEADSSRCDAAARFLWAHLRTLDEWNVAYNLEVIERGEGRFISFLFPRAPGSPIRMPGGDTLGPNFGGWELSGDIVVPTRGIFEWIRSHPGEALRLTSQRLHDTTRASPGSHPSNVDRPFGAGIQ